MGHRDLIIIGVTADIYALDSRHQFLSAGMNGVLIKPLSLRALENELTRYFAVVDPKELNEEYSEYSFDAFSNLLKDRPEDIVLILDEIKKVHDETSTELEELYSKDLLTETEFKSMVHKVKGGAQLLNAKAFTEECQKLEKDGLLNERVGQFFELMKQQNQVIQRYQDKYGG
jgi:two-component system sensor histidine kinase EvgS